MSQHLQIANQSFLRQEKQKLVEDPPRKMEIDKLINVENKDQGEPLNSGKFFLGYNYHAGQNKGVLKNWESY